MGFPENIFHVPAEEEESTMYGSRTLQGGIYKLGQIRTVCDTKYLIMDALLSESNI